jgi:hypothetical protein
VKVGELIEILNNAPKDAEVVMSSDSEGNNFSPLSETTSGYYVPESTWRGSFYDHEFTAEDNCMDDDEYADLISQPIAICLWPTN